MAADSDGKATETDRNDSKNTTLEMIEARLRQWKTSGKYRNSGITIESLATEIGTNRVYLSAVVNKTAGHTFREWITSLRIEDAKRLLERHDDMSVADVARHCGFSSGSYFVRLFSASEGMTPARWRMHNTRKKRK